MKKKKKIFKNSDILLVLAVVMVILMMIIPIPSFLLDLFLTFNITFSLTILLVAMYTLEPLSFSVFPSLLLIVTLLRLSLNISGTRLILLHGYAGEVIMTFGSFVVGGNYLVGVVIFLILVIIQFVVITHGAQRVAEVAARFTLDAMPGKQMSIDADLSAGLINQEDARERRKHIEREADFYGAMDGAGKFIRGDAIAAVIIIIINIVGGFAVGILQQGLPLIEALQRYTLLTVGEGLVTQIPALLISTAMGIIVTRAASDADMGDDLAEQILAQPRALSIISVLLVFFGLIPGLPKIPFFLMAAGVGFLAYKVKKSSEKPDDEEASGEKKEEKEPEDVISLLDIEPLELDIGCNLIPLVDEEAGGDLLGRVLIVRKSCAIDSGIVIPPIRIRDNIQLRPNVYQIKIYGEKVSEGEVMMGRCLAIPSGEVVETIDGIETSEPAFGLPARWVKEEDKERAEMMGYTIVDPSSVIATHLSEIIKTKSPDLLGRQEAQALLDNLQEKYPVLIKEVTPNLLSLGEIQKVLQNLLSERISIRNLRLILEVLADFATISKDIFYLTEQVRVAMAKTICEAYQQEDGAIPVITLGVDVEELITESVREDKFKPFSAISPDNLKMLYKSLLKSVKKTASLGYQPIIITSQGIRFYVKKLTQKVIPNLVVLSYDEICNGNSVETIDILRLNSDL